jgi:hypothetical protein
MTDRADLEKLISDAKRVAKSRKLATLVYLLELATIELAKAEDPFRSLRSMARSADADAHRSPSGRRDVPRL